MAAGGEHLLLQDNSLKRSLGICSRVCFFASDKIFHLWPIQQDEPSARIWPVSAERFVGGTQVNFFLIRV